MQNRAERWRRQGYEFAINQPEIIATFALFLNCVPISRHFYNYLFQNYDLMTRAEIVGRIGFFSGKYVDGQIKTIEAGITYVREFADQNIPIVGNALQRARATVRNGIAEANEIIDRIIFVGIGPVRM